MDTTMIDTDWWWVDYLENELDAALERDLETLLKHSVEDQESFEKFRLLKQWLKESDPVDTCAIEARLPRLHARVMAAIDNPAKPGPRRRHELDASL